MPAISSQNSALCTVNLNPTITHNSSSLWEVYVTVPEKNVKVRINHQKALIFKA